MKRFKKAISVVSALAMTMSMLGSMSAVQAEDAEIYGWKRYTANTETAMANVVETGTIDGQTVTPASGSRMLEMKAGETEEEAVYVTEKLQAGTYTISFKVNYKQNVSLHWAAAATMGWKGFGTDVNEGAFARLTSETLEGGWMRYSGEITLSSVEDGVWNGRTNNFVIKFKTAKNSNKVMYVDDVSVKDADYNEYVINGGFELDAPAPEPEPDVITENILGWERMPDATETETSNIVTSGEISGAAVTPIRGSRMLEIKSGASNSYYVCVPQMLEAGTYTASFCVKYPSSAEWTAYARLGTKNWGNDNSGKFARIGDTADHPGTKETLSSDGWVRFTQEFTLSGTEIMYGTDNIIIGFSADNNGNKVMYIDDVSVKDASGTEYVTNGGFEEVDPMAFSNYTLSIDGTPMDIIADGSAEAKVTVKNNKAEDMSAQIIVASYASDSSLLNVETSNVITITGNTIKVVYTNTPITIDEKVQNVKVFLWDSLNGMTPLKSMQEYIRSTESV